MYDMDKLRFLASLYCDRKNLVYDSYMEGLLSNGELSQDMIKALVDYHKEYLK
jgi:hypothetical protein